MDPKPYQEPFSATILRTTLIAIGVGTAITVLSPILPETNFWILLLSRFCAVFWISFGGHWVELLYLNWWQMKTRKTGVSRVTERILFWLPFGLLLFSGAWITQSLISAGKFPSGETLFRAAIAGPFLFVLVELIVHTILNATKLDSIFNGRG